MAAGTVKGPTKLTTELFLVFRETQMKAAIYTRLPIPAQGNTLGRKECTRRANTEGEGNEIFV